MINIDTVKAVNFLLENNLKFRVKVSDIQLKEILSEFIPYNEMPSNLKEIVAYTHQLIGPTNFAGNNPNNGHFDNIEFEIGNECSLVIYITVKPMYQINSNRDSIMNKLHLIGAKFEADENLLVTDDQDTFITQRIWWD